MLLILQGDGSEASILQHQIEKSRKFMDTRKKYLEWAKKEISDLKNQSAEEKPDQEWAALRSAVISSSSIGQREENPADILREINDSVHKLAVYAASQLKYHSQRSDRSINDQNDHSDLLLVLGPFLWEELRSSPTEPRDSRTLQYALRGSITFIMHQMLRRFSIASHAFPKSLAVDAAFVEVANQAIRTGKWHDYQLWEASHHS